MSRTRKQTKIVGLFPSGSGPADPANLRVVQTDQAIPAAYTRNGFYIRERLLTEAECDELKAEAVRVLRERAKPAASVYVGAAAVSPLFYKLADDPRVVAILRAILPGGVMFLSDKIVYKSGAKTFATPWHIDAFYWRGTRPKLSIWIPLDDASADNGTLIVVPGSHTRDWDHVAGDSTKTNNEFGREIARRQWAESDEVVCNIPRGSAVFFSDRLAHASCPNTAGRDRYTIISTYHAPAIDEPFDLHFPARHVIEPCPVANS